MRKIVILSLLILLLISCKEIEYPMIKLTDVYTTNDIDTLRNYTNLFQHNDEIYCIGDNNYLCTLNENGEIIEEKNIYGNVSYYLFDSENNAIYVTYDDGNYTLHKYTKDDELIYEHDLFDLFNGETFYLQHFNIDNRDNLYLVSTEKIVVMNSQLQKLFQIDIDNATSIFNVYKDKNGDILVHYTNRNTSTRALQYIDVEKEAYGDKISIPKNAVTEYYFLHFGNGYDFYVGNRNGLYGFDTGDEEAVLLVNWINSCMTGSVVNLIPITPEKIIIIDRDNLALMTKVADKDVVEKKIITLATTDYEATALATLVTDYNKRNAEYFIVINDYTNDITKLEMEIIQGIVPDIIYTMHYDKIRNYVEKGLFVDLHEYFDKDKDISVEDLFKCVYEPFEINDEMHFVTTEFSFYGSGGKVKNIGDGSYTVVDLIDIAENLPDDSILYDYNLRGFITNPFILMIMGHFIDYDNAECNFIDEDFYRVIEYMKSIPTTRDRDLFGEENLGNMFKEDKCILSWEIYLSKFRDYLVYKNIFNGEDYAFIKHPYKYYSGFTVFPVDCFTMTIGANHKNEIWNFFKYLLSDEIQQTGIRGFPSMKQSYYNKAEAELEKSIYYHFTTLRSSTYVDVEDIPNLDGRVLTLTNEDIDYIYNLIENLDYTYRSRSNTLMDIINEEIQIFYETDRSAEDIAKIIQSRVSIFLSENR